MRRIKKLYCLILKHLFYKFRFGYYGKKSVVFCPLKLDECKSIYIDDNVVISDKAWLMGGDKEEITLRIAKGTRIGNFAHIIAKHMVYIEESVLIADKVFISDCTHSYEDINVPVTDQGIRMLNDVHIGKGSWIGEGVCICGAKIGKHCVIGANSVVTKDIPDYSVAAGSPAIVVKKYDFNRETWVKVSKEK